MKCLIIDPFCGASEAMILGALLGCGADEWRVRSVVESLCDAPLDVQDGRTGGLAVKLAEINVAAARQQHPAMDRAEALEKLNVMHEHQTARVDSMKIAEILFNAQEALHGKGYRMDVYTLAMIAGITTAYDALSRPLVQCTPVAVGGGRDKNGEPVPQPVVLKIVSGTKVILQGGPLEGALLTLTAAAIFAYYVQESGRYYPENRPQAVAYGGGNRKIEGMDALRMTLCEVDDALLSDRMELLETNVDDVTGEVLGSLIESLMEMGAMDVCVVPATMKKGRAGHIIRVVVKADQGPAIARRIVLETGSLGVRVLPVKHRFIAKRKIVNLDIPVEGKRFDMRFKVATDMNDKIIDVSVEYDDAKMVSRELVIPIKTVMRIAETEAWKHYE